jgi:hypothetical protein
VSYQSDTSARPATVSAARPGTLTAAIVVAVVAGVAAVANGLFVILGGKDLIKELLATSAGVPVSDGDLELLEGFAGISLDELQNTLNTRAYGVLICGAALLLFGLLMSKAALWARILVTVSAALAVMFSIVIVADATVPVMAICSMVTILAGIVAVVLTWLPANSRYARSTR